MEWDGVAVDGSVAGVGGEGWRGLIQRRFDSSGITEVTRQQRWRGARQVLESRQGQYLTLYYSSGYIVVRFSVTILFSFI